MPPASLAAWPLLSRPWVCASCRRASSDLFKQSRSRTLHAAPPLLHPRRREFFSSNPALLSQRQDTEEKTKDDGSGTAIASPQKRKTARSPAAKTSLRRVAVEAQRSKDGNLARGRPASEEASLPKLVTAYAVAEQFDLSKVVDILRSKGYEPDPLGTGLYPQVVHIQVPISSIYRIAKPAAEGLAADEVGDVFVFPSGTLVTWALPEGFTSFFATRTLLSAAQSPHVGCLESEELDYVEEPNREHSIVRGDTIILGTKPSTTPTLQSPEEQAIDTVLTKIAFSSGFARSTKLAVLETSLSSYLTSTSQIPTLLSKGSRLPFSISRSFILRKTGQLLSLRAQLNLYSELTDSLPDLFWDSRHELGLEGYYDQVGRALDVGIRIKVLNEKMDYAQEIASVLRERLSEKHGLFLEWTIIVLIAIEVGFEILRLHREGFWDEVMEKRRRKRSSTI